MKKIVITIVIAIAIITTNGCITPQRKLAKLLEKHPELSKDSITYVFDTIIQKYKYTDTVFNDKIDTLIKIENNVKISYFHDTLLKKIYIKGECLPDTIIKKNPIYIKTIKNQIVQKKDFFWYGGIFFLILLVFSILFSILRFLKI